MSRPGPLPSPANPSTRPFGTTIFDQLQPGGAAAQAAPSPFDVCHVGVVLRSVLFVHAVVGVAVSFVVGSWSDWLLALAHGAAVALPATLLWLVLCCALKRLLVRASAPVQWVVAIGLGAICGAYGWWQVGWVELPLTQAVHGVAPLLAGAGLSAMMFYALKLRSRSQLPAVTRARLAELQSRIRPHFLFNTLNAAIALVRVDPARAEAVLEDLSELFRVALIESGHAVTLAEEVDLARRYLAIEQIRFGQRLRVEWDLDPAAGEVRVPPLVLQPLVENAVRHGIEPAPEGGYVRIRTQVRGSLAVLTVTNSLPPTAPSPTTGHGMALRNVKERLRLMHDVSAQFAAGPDHGTWRVHIAVPLRS
ncbi:MAG: histidine kinase [Caldimonas sp.]|uniref:sensor histidine kinase n=1 Tax=Caldimonas taiwanensis TaxID=307483 RepID=UPI000A78C80E|nr:histidine kinase [Caldimonas taiwanensis]GIX24292.1 MAG: histidine kinase [Caldimonas sp.]